MKVVTVVGARPQFIKAAPVSKMIRQKGYKEYLIHTGQHYDYNMSQVFFEELQISEPDINLGVGSGSHGFQTGQMLINIEEILLQQQPDFMLVYGDTNSTLAGSLAAVKLHIPVAHVEAGLRSFNRQMPEEHNRVVTDHCSDLLFCPTQTAIVNLQREGIIQGVHLVGDTMYDAVLQWTELADTYSKALQMLEIKPKQYLLATVHRAENTDDPDKMAAILRAFAEIRDPIIFPVHPRTQRVLQKINYIPPTHVRLIDPVSYLDMLLLERNARMIMTDSGGIQKEAFFFGVPCVTLRTETEWIETVTTGWNVVTGTDIQRIVEATYRQAPVGPPPPLYGNGNAAESIVDILARSY